MAEAVFPEMRRSKQLIPLDESVEMLRGEPHGVLVTSGTDGYPYAVPVHFAYVQSDPEESLGTIYIHSFPEGHKIDAVEENNRVSFTTICRDDVLPTQTTSMYSSVICFGRARLTDDNEKRFALTQIGYKYSPGHDDHVNREINEHFHELVVIAVDIETITGKEGVELARQRREAAEG